MSSRWHTVTIVKVLDDDRNVDDEPHISTVEIFPKEA